MMSDNIQMITSKEEFDTCVDTGITLVDFWAPWCNPCRMQLPILDKIASKFAGKAKVAKVNVDENNDLASVYQVSSIPALFLFKDGVMVQQFVGVQSETILSQAITKEI